MRRAHVPPPSSPSSPSPSLSTRRGPTPPPPLASPHAGRVNAAGSPREALADLQRDAAWPSCPQRGATGPCWWPPASLRPGATSSRSAASHPDETLTSCAPRHHRPAPVPPPVAAPCVETIPKFVCFLLSDPYSSTCDDSDPYSSLRGKLALNLDQHLIRIVLSMLLICLFYAEHMPLPMM